MHPIDRLGEIRQQMRKLRQEQNEIIAKLDAGTITAEGLRYKARTHQRVVLHPIQQPAPPDLYSYQNPLSYQHLQNQPNQFHQQAQNTFGQHRFDEGAFGSNGGLGLSGSNPAYGEPALGFGKREG
jgi:hypothetical protein